MLHYTSVWCIHDIYVSPEAYSKGNITYIHIGVVYHFSNTT